MFNSKLWVLRRTQAKARELHLLLSHCTVAARLRTALQHLRHLREPASRKLEPSKGSKSGVLIGKIGENWPEMRVDQAKSGVNMSWATKQYIWSAKMYRFYQQEPRAYCQSKNGELRQWRLTHKCNRCGNILLLVRTRRRMVFTDINKNLNACSIIVIYIYAAHIKDIT